MFLLPPYRLYHDFATVPARFVAVDFRMAADMGADGA